MLVEALTHVVSETSGGHWVPHRLHSMTWCCRWMAKAAGQCTQASVVRRVWRAAPLSNSLPAAASGHLVGYHIHPPTHSPRGPSLSLLSKIHSKGVHSLHYGQNMWWPLTAPAPAGGGKARSGDAAAVLASMRRASLQAAEDASSYRGVIIAQGPPGDAADVAALASPCLALVVPPRTLFQRWQVGAPVPRQSGTPS